MQFHRQMDRSGFNLHCQVRKMDEAMRSINEYTFMSREVQSDDWPCQYFH